MLDYAIASGGESEELLVARIDLDRVEAVRAKLPAYKDRRPELYTIRRKEPVSSFDGVRLLIAKSVIKVGFAVGGDDLPFRIDYQSGIVIAMIVRCLYRLVHAENQPDPMLTGLRFAEGKYLSDLVNFDRLVEEGVKGKIGELMKVD